MGSIDKHLQEAVGFLPLDKAAFASVEGNENAFLAQ